MLNQTKKDLAVPKFPFWEISKYVDNIRPDLGLQYIPRFEDIPAYIPVETTSDENKINIRAEVPGVAKEDIFINFEENLLCINIEKKTKENKNIKNIHYSDICYGKVSRKIRLSERIDEDQIKASLRDGILSIEIGLKIEEKPKKKHIVIS